MNEIEFYIELAKHNRETLAFMLQSKALDTWADDAKYMYITRRNDNASRCLVKAGQLITNNNTVEFKRNLEYLTL